MHSPRTTPILRHTLLGLLAVLLASAGAQAMNWGTSTGQGQSGLESANLPADQVHTNGPLVANGEANDAGIDVNGCADIFVLDQTARHFPFDYDLDDAITVPQASTILVAGRPLRVDQPIVPCVFLEPGNRLAQHLRLRLGEVVALTRVGAQVVEFPGARAIGHFLEDSLPAAHAQGATAKQLCREQLAVAPGARLPGAQQPEQRAPRGRLHLAAFKTIARMRHSSRFE